jgi:hypothetical protein
MSTKPVTIKSTNTFTSRDLHSNQKSISKYQQNTSTDKHHATVVLEVVSILPSIAKLFAQQLAFEGGLRPTSYIQGHWIRYAWKYRLNTNRNDLTYYWQDLPSGQTPNTCFGLDSSTSLLAILQKKISPDDIQDRNLAQRLRLVDLRSGTETMTLMAQKGSEQQYIGRDSTSNGYVKCSC